MFRRAIYFASAVAFCSIVGGASVQAQLRPGGISNANGISACPDSVSAPQTVTTPCVAIVQFNSTASLTDRRAVVQQAGAVMRFNYNSMNMAAALIPNEGSYRALATQSNVVRLIPDRQVHSIRSNPGGGGGGKPGGGSGGGSTGQVVPAGVHHIGADRAWTKSSSCCTGSGVTVAILTPDSTSIIPISPPTSSVALAAWARPNIPPPPVA